MSTKWVTRAVGGGWCGNTFPVQCTNCGSLVHADFGDENADCDYWLNYACDKCGDQYEFEG